jgi:hypothetical protein
MSYKEISLFGTTGLAFDTYRTGQLVETTTVAIRDSDFTMSAWIFPTKEQENATMIFSKDKSGDGKCEFRFQMNYDRYIYYCEI